MKNILLFVLVIVSESYNCQSVITLKQGVARIVLYEGKKIQFESSNTTSINEEWDNLCNTNSRDDVWTIDSIGVNGFLRLILPTEYVRDTVVYSDFLLLNDEAKDDYEKNWDCEPMLTIESGQDVFVFKQLCKYQHKELNISDLTRIRCAKTNMCDAKTKSINIYGLVCGGILVGEDFTNNDVLDKFGALPQILGALTIFLFADELHGAKVKTYDMSVYKIKIR